MEEYLKKQKEKNQGATKAKPAPAPAARKTGTGKDISESSDKYTDEDFDSISKS